MNQHQDILSNPNDLPWQFRLVWRIFSRMQYGSLTAVMPDGRHQRFAGNSPGPDATVRFSSARAVTRVLLRGEIGFAEGYMAGDWDAPELSDLLYLMHLNEDYLIPKVRGLHGLMAAWSSMRHRLRRNSRRGAKRNIAYHYDLGNDFYDLWLDDTWTYSSAVFAAPGQALPEAQRHKYDLLLERLAPAPGDRILELGCGWGGFAIHAATTTGARVTGITLSEEQLAFARERVRDAGLEGQIDFRLQDYRDVDEQFDHVASIEMYEAVGEDFWPDYFRAIYNALKPGGRAAVQGITIGQAGFAAYRNEVDFIQTYIFPGGMLASPEIFQAQAEARGLRVREPAFFGAHYAETLRRWDSGVLVARAEIRRRFDERFLRMWRYYLAYCEAGFRSGNIDLMQITLERS